MRRFGVLLGIALVIAGCGGSNTTASTTTEPPAKPAPGATDKAAALKTLRDYFKANAAGDYGRVCALFTAKLRRSAAEAHDPGSTDCISAFNAEADPGSAANEIYAEAKIDSISVANGAATATILFGGASEPATARLRKSGSRWLMVTEP